MSSREVYFHSAVNSVLSNWTALRMMVANNPSVGDAFLPWLVDATVQWFGENRDLAPAEVEGFFEQVVVDEFNVSVEDGSLSEVGRRVWELHGDCATLGEEALAAKISALPKGVEDLKASCRVADSAETVLQGCDGVEAAAAAPVGPEEEEDEDDNSAMDVEEDNSARRKKPQTDEDGWTTVPSRRKR